MKLDRLIELFAGQDGDKHDVEVSLADLRAWQAELKRLRQNYAISEGINQAQDGVIERLRAIKCNLVDEGKLLVCKAPAEIERLQAALTYIRDDSTDLDDAKTVARFALELRVL